MKVLSRKLVELIERNADNLTKRWLDDVKKHPGTKTYHAYDEKKLYQRAFTVYSQFDKWMSQETTKEEIKRIYMALGKQRRQEGFALSEVVQALTITRRHIWLLVRSEGLLDTALDLYQAIDLINRSVLFFDRAIYFTTMGFETKD
ncbi:MAG TPA: RsbRD N-terminal domain-containing protein [Syntrophales bacterium]|nr:RsbRD N-terminal domain-containing protein [Syntrophales bacterium]